MIDALTGTVSFDNWSLGPGGDEATFASATATDTTGDPWARRVGEQGESAAIGGCARLGCRGSFWGDWVGVERCVVGLESERNWWLLGAFGCFFGDAELVLGR